MNEKQDMVGEAITCRSPGESPVPRDREEASLEAGAVAAEPPLTAQQLAELKAKAAKADEHWDRLLRAKADLENYRKRATRERQEAVQYAQLSFLQKLVPALDSFDKALALTEAPEGANWESMKTGLNLVYEQLKSTLTEAGLEEIDARQQPFDPNVHEALAQHESTEVPEGHVLQQVRKGYKLRDRLIRPASVIVAKKPAG
jgi:molecular chaperone GrpE